MQAQDVKAPQIQVQAKDMKLGSLDSLEPDVEGIDPFDIDNDSPINFNPPVSAIKKSDSNATSQLNPLLQRQDSSPTMKPKVMALGKMSLAKSQSNVPQTAMP